MPLNRLLQIVTATLAAMGTMLLGMGQRDIGMTLLMILAAGLSVWLTDVKGWLYLNRNVANLIMLGVALFSLRDLFHIYSEMQALTFAQFLIYLQIILLFQKKDDRTYWLLIMLSLLQVVVAALFSQGVFFGMLLVVYMLLASWALTLLMLNREGKPSPSRSLRLFTLTRKSDPPLLATGSNALSKNGKGQAVSRWPLVDQQPGFDGAAAGNSRQGVGGELFRRLLGMSVRALGLTMVLFVVVPRFGQVGWRGGFAQPTATVGFNDQVTLGEMGQIIESPSEVMRIRFFKGKSDVPYPTSGEIYVYGGWLWNYNRGQWDTGTIIKYQGDETLTKKPGVKLPKSYVVQQCEIEGLDHNEVFFVDPYVPIESNSFIYVQEILYRLTRDKALRTQKFSYRLGTTVFRDGIQLPLTPRRPPAEENYRTEDQYATRVPRENGELVLKKLKALADEWIAESKLPPEKVYQRARFLENKLAYSGLFKYSLEGQTRDSSMDPIEDFLTVHKAGHCEYFATALTLMLRHVDIPARMVVGFKCDEWHEAEQCYQVRQLHAHTWVQAYLKPDQLPKEFLHGEDYWNWEKNGGWLQLDPTPGRGEEANSGIFSPIAKGLQWLDFTWSYYVVELNSERQRKAIFAPLAAAATKMFNTLRDPKTWAAFYERIGEALHRSGVAGAVAWGLLILSLAAGLALLGLIGFFLWRRGRKLWRLLAAKRGNRRRGPRIEVEFYRRLEHLLAKNGLSRPLGQTPREFAFAAGQWLAAETGQHRLLPLPNRIVDAYYRVRFGRLPLEAGHSHEIDQILKEMESQIVHRKAHGALNGKNDVTPPDSAVPR
jgi:protein-glutamine gamma-glutamyltransferase